MAAVVRWWCGSSSRISNSTCTNTRISAINDLFAGHHVYAGGNRCVVLVPVSLWLLLLSLLQLYLSCVWSAWHREHGLFCGSCSLQSLLVVSGPYRDTLGYQRVLKFRTVSFLLQCLPGELGSTVAQQYRRARPRRNSAWVLLACSCVGGIIRNFDPGCTDVGGVNVTIPF